MPGIETPSQSPTSGDGGEHSSSRHDSSRDYESIETFVTEADRESDRVAVILGAAKIDLLLYQILHSFLRPIASTIDELLDGDAPLSTLNSRIHACYRLGLIDSELARALHILRRLRNAFAHEPSGCDLDRGAHRERVRELIKPFKAFEKFHSFRKHFAKRSQGIAAEFRTALAIIVVRLERVREQVRPIVVSAEMTLTFHDWDKQNGDRNAPLPKEPEQR